MIIRPMSDIHLEFDGTSPWYMPVIEGEKDMTLILAGDITAKHNYWKNNPERDTYTPWIKDVCARHKNVIYIKGNHEDYAGDLCATERYWKAVSDNIENLHFLNRDVVVIDGVRFLGCTLWTDLSPVQETMSGQMNDFDEIWVDEKFFTVQDWKMEHSACRYFLDTEIEKDFDGETVVVTHHCPSFQSIHEKYAGEAFNPFYASSLEKYMWYFPIKYWIHGHTHESMDYMVGDEIQSTRVLCNPRGYNNDSGGLNTDFNPTLTFEV